MNCTGKRCIMQFDKVDPATCKLVSYCPQATPPKTNADLIRAMTDENLAILLSGMSCRRCPIDCKGGYMNCSDYWLEWLKEEGE